jgi:ornithine cyclodeaminase/alanine dehydrogenase-like protein (mu-crystallin family)
MPLLLTEDQIRRVLPLDDLITTMESALARFSAGDVQQPVRTVLSVGPENAFFGVMPAFSPPSALGCKLVTLFKGNTARGLPTHLATIVLLDPETGAMQALLDGRYITEVRTAAVSAVSARHLARPDAGTLAILGSGVQAKSHLETLRYVRPVRTVRVWSPTAANRERFAREAPAEGPPVTPVSTAEEADRDADLVVLATSSPTPVVSSDWIAEGAHVMAVGACRPNEREMDPALVARGRLFVDSRAGALVESGDIVMGIAEGLFEADHIAGEIGEVVLGRSAGREAPGEVTIFKSLGMAVEDVAAADLACRRAAAHGIGADFTLE